VGSIGLNRGFVNEKWGLRCNVDVVAGLAVVDRIDRFANSAAARTLETTTVINKKGQSHILLHPWYERQPF